jgi:hypothetical protein
LLKRRISTPRAASVVALAAVVAAATAATPSLAGQFLTSKQAGKFITSQKVAKTYLSNKKASTLYLKKEAASNLFAAKATAPKVPVVGIAAGTAQFGPVSATTAGYVPSAFTSFATKASTSSVVISFSGAVICTADKPAADQACPVQILVDGQATGKVNLAPATAASPTPLPIVQTVVQTTVLTKGGHTVAVQYAGASKVTFTLKSWNLAVEAYPQPEPEPVEETTTK